MTQTKAHIKATAKYNKKAYTLLSLRLRNDSPLNKDAIQAAADAAGESLNGYILEAISRRIESGT